MENAMRLVGLYIDTYKKSWFISVLILEGLNIASLIFAPVSFVITIVNIIFGGTSEVRKSNWKQLKVLLKSLGFVATSVILIPISRAKFISISIGLTNEMLMETYGDTIYIGNKSATEEVVEEYLKSLKK